MDLGAFSVSLAVKDIKASRAFYEKLGFEVFHGNEDENWLMLRHGKATIGLFQGMFEKNILTFNPRDVRAVQAELRAQGIEPLETADPTTEGPAYITLIDPYGNPILVDQHPEDTPGLND